MYLQLLLTPRLPDGSLDHAQRTALRFDRFPVALSGGDADGVVPADWPAGALVIAGPREQGGDFTVQALAEGLDLHHQEHHIGVGDRLRNGGEYDVGDRLHLRLVVGFPVARHRRRLPIAGSLVLGTIAAVLLGQFIYILFVNSHVKVDRLLSTETQRHRVYAMLDVNRDLIYHAQQDLSSSAGPRLLSILAVRAELDRMAAHLRDHGEDMDREQLSVMLEDLIRLTPYSEALSTGELPPPPDLAVQGYLAPMLEKDSAPDDAETGP